MEKFLLVVSVSLIFASIAYASSFKCYRYVNGKPTGAWVKVTADSKSEAEGKAYARMKEIGGKVDYCKCKCKY